MIMPVLTEGPWISPCTRQAHPCVRPNPKTFAVHTSEAAPPAKATMAAAAAAKAATGKLGAGCEKVPVHLPPITEEDPLHQDKKVRRERKKKARLFWFDPPKPYE